MLLSVNTNKLDYMSVSILSVLYFKKALVGDKECIFFLVVSVKIVQNYTASIYVTSN